MDDLCDWLVVIVPTNHQHLVVSGLLLVSDTKHSVILVSRAQWCSNEVQHQKTAVYCEDTNSAEHVICTK